MGKAVQEGKDLFRGDVINRAIAEFLNKSLDDGQVSSPRIFLEWILW